jgi:prepilin-type processing-associated H-X9-DG protein
MSQPFLFYSERCPNSQQIIATLKGLNKTGLYKFILVETIPRNQIPSFLKAVPTLYNPETKDVIVGKDIYGYIAKPTNARKEIPQKETANGPSAQISGPIGDLSPWGFEGMGRLTENYSMWDAPSTFASGGGSNYTFLDGSSFGGTHGGAELPGVKGPDTQNTIKEKTGSNDDVKQRMEMMQKQREKEFAGVERK